MTSLGSSRKTIRSSTAAHWIFLQPRRNLGINPETIKENSDYLLNFSVKLKEATEWADAGFEIAYEQFELEFDPAVKAEALNVSGMNPFTSVEGLEDEADVLKASGVTDQGQEFSFTLNKTNGVIENYKVDGITLCLSEPSSKRARS